MLRPDVADDLSRRDAADDFGLITEALARRRESTEWRRSPCCCDNIQGNGDVARAPLHGVRHLSGTRSWAHGWARGRVPPNSMVDRITPDHDAEDRAEVRERFGIDDGGRWCEPFTQWVLEDGFSSAGRPLDSAGVQVVDDVEPYELMKLRLLNASHQALGYLGYLAGYRLVHEAAQDPLFSLFLRLLDGRRRQRCTGGRRRPGRVLAQADRAVLQSRGPRHNRAAGLRRSIPSKWLLPVIREHLAAGGEVSVSAAVVAKLGAVRGGL